MHRIRAIAMVGGVAAVMALTAAPSDAGKPGGGGGGTTARDVAFLDTSSSWTLALVSANGTGVTSLLADVLYGDPAWSPDGTTVAFTTRRTDTGSGLYTLKVSDGTLRKLCSVTSVVGKPAWSPVATPDGSPRILFADAGAGGIQDLFAIRPDGTDLVNLTNTSDRTEGVPAWAPDGTRFAAFCAGKVRVYELASSGLSISGSVELSFSNVTVSSISLDWARTRDRIACMGTDGDLWVLDVTNPTSATARKILDVTGGQAETPSWSPNDGRLVYCRTGFSGKGSNGLFTAAYSDTGSLSDERTLVASSRDLLCSPDWVRVTR